MPHGSVIYDLAEALGNVLKKRNLRCAVAESCTGGNLAGVMTSIPGSSQWFDRGFVTYSNQAKEQMLGVSQKLIRKHGAVSEDVAKAMAHGVIKGSEADVAVAITGIAGPDGGSEEKPVGTVWIAWAGDNLPTHSQCYHFIGNRPAVRHQAVQTALEGLIKRSNPKTHLSTKLKDTSRYFFALFPNDAVMTALKKQGKKEIGSEDCSPIPVANLHLTLVYLGCIPPDLLQEAMRAAVKIKQPQFNVTLTTAGVWLRAKAMWFGLKNMPIELMALVDELHNHLLPTGFVPEKKPFVPHVTIARQWRKKIQPHCIPPISWAVSEFCLVKSTPEKTGSHYEKIACWPLKSK